MFVWTFSDLVSLALLLLFILGFLFYCGWELLKTVWESVISFFKR